MGMIYLRGDTYWIKYYRNGKPYRESARTKKETDARKFLKKREGEVADGRFRGLRAEKVKFEEISKDLITDYEVNKRKSIVHAKIRVKHLDDFFKGMRVNDIDTPTVSRYVVMRRDQGAENATVNRELAALKRAFSLAVKCTPPKALHAPYIPMLKENNTRSNFFEQEDYHMMMDTLPDYLRPIFAASYFTGWRKEELLSLTWANNVNLFERKLTLAAGTTKNGKARTAFMPEPLYEILRAQYSASTHDYPECPFVFHKAGERIGDFRNAWAQALVTCGYKATFKCRDCGATVEIDVGQRWKKDGQTLYVADGEVRKGKKAIWQKIACSHCQSERFQRWGRVFHDNRRTAVRNLTRTGTPEGVAMEQTGHLTRSVFERYNIVSENDLRGAAERLGWAHKQMEEKAQEIASGHKKGTIGPVK
jgi:integrase